MTMVAGYSCGPASRCGGRGLVEAETRRPKDASLMRWVLGLGLAALTACSPGAQDEIARSAAKEAVRPVLAERFPGVPLEGATDCVIDNATSQEILALAADAVTGPTASTVEMVAQIVTRPDAVRCLVREGAALAIVMGAV